MPGILRKSNHNLTEITEVLSEIEKRENTDKVLHVYLTYNEISSLKGIDKMPDYICGINLDHNSIKHIDCSKLPAHLYHFKMDCELLEELELQKLLKLITNTLICKEQLLMNLPLKEQTNFTITQEDFKQITSSNKENITNISIHINNNIYDFSNNKLLCKNFSFTNYKALMWLKKYQFVIIDDKSINLSSSGKLNTFNDIQQAINKHEKNLNYLLYGYVHDYNKVNESSVPSSLIELLEKFIVLDSNNVPFSYDGLVSITQENIETNLDFNL